MLQADSNGRNWISTINMPREDWLKIRKQGIGSSDHPSVLGLNPYQTPRDCYLDKIDTNLTTDRDIDPIMEAGIRLEPIIAEWFSEKSGYKVRNDFKVRFHPQNKWLLANNDRMIVDPGDGRGPGICECKLTNQWAKKNWPDGLMPDWYYGQLQHQMAVTGVSWGAIAVLVDRYLEWYEFEFSLEYWEAALPKLAQFWFENVLPRKEPAPVNIKDVLDMFPGHTPGKIVELNETQYAQYEALIQIREEFSQLKKDKEKLENELKIIMGDAEELVYGQARLATWKQAATSMKFNEKKFAADHFELYEQYLEPKPGSRRFLVK